MDERSKTLSFFSSLLPTSFFLVCGLNFELFPDTVIVKGPLVPNAFDCLSSSEISPVVRGKSYYSSPGRLHMLITNYVSELSDLDPLWGDVSGIDSQRGEQWSQTL